MQRATLAVFLTVLVGASVASADRGPKGQPTFDISGNYTSNWGRVTLRQIGNKVVGTHVC